MMICAIEQTMLFGPLVLLGLGVGFFVEEVATRMGYKPKNFLPAGMPFVRRSAHSS